MQIITVTVAKGGTGKTTTAAALAQAAAYKGRRVLAIDLDPQGNLSAALATRAGNPNANAYNLITGATPPDQNIVASGTGYDDAEPQGLDVIPASQNLTTVTSGRGSARRLQKALQPIRDRYDYIFIDTPAGGELQYNALQASTGLIIPLFTDSYSIQSLYQTDDLASQFRRSNPALSFTGVIITRFDGRSIHAQQLRDTIKEQAAGLRLPYLGEIRQSVKVQEAASFMRSLYEHAPKATVTKDYLRVFEELERV